MISKTAIVISLVTLGTSVSAAAGWMILHPRDKLANATALAAKGDVRGARILMRGAVQDDPTRAEPHFRLGLLDLRLGDPIAGEKELAAARDRGWPAQSIVVPMAEAMLAQHRYADVLRGTSVDAVPADAAAALLVARAQAELGLQHLDAAQATIAEAEHRDPQSGLAALVASRVAQARGDFVLAAAKADHAAALMPHMMDAQLQVAQLRVGRGDRAGALAAYDAAASDRFAPPERLLFVRLSRAALLTELGDARADAEISAILAEQPRLPYGLYLQAVQLARTEQWSAADIALNRIGSAIETIPRAEFLQAIVKGKVGQPAQALDAAEHAVARSPTDLAAARLLASMYLAQHHPEQASRVLARVADNGPPDMATLSMLAQAYTAAGQPAKAQSALEAAARLTPSDRQIAAQLAGAQLRAGDPRRASLTLERALDAVPVALPGGAPTPDAGPSAIQTATALVLTALQAGDVDRASVGVARLRQLHADEGQVALLDGMTKMARVDLPGARAAFETALRLKPDSIPPRLALARIDRQQNDLANAAFMLGQVLDIDKTNLQALAALSDLDLAAGDPQSAVRRLENAHQANPNNVQITVGLSDLYIRTGVPAKALALLDAVPADDAGSKANAGIPPAATQDGLLAARVRAQSAVGQRREAAMTGRVLLDRLPGNTALRIQLAEMLAADKDWTGAAKIVSDGLALQPGNGALLALDVRLASQADGPAAGLARADKLAADPANAGAARTLKGDLLLAEHRYDDAAAAYAAQTGPGAPAVLVLHHAEALGGAGHADKVPMLLRDWLAGHPDSPDVLVTLASFEIASGQLADARTHLERGLALQPGNPVALNNYAWLLQQAGELQMARQAANRAWLLSPSPQAADTLGWIALASGEKEMALVLLNQAATALKDDPTVQFHLASALQQNGRQKEARSILARLVALPTPFAEKGQASAMLKSLAP